MSPSFFYLIRTFSHPQAPLRSVHAVTEVASYRRMAHPLSASTTAFGACGY
ncbi:MAG: hypothetical protein IKQ08_11840 [Paludibacteraceae bacterium]|nr:hypothetical protein [Paludibacteraceae bacterium]